MMMMMTTRAIFFLSLSFLSLLMMDIIYIHHIHHSISIVCTKDFMHYLHFNSSCHAEPLKEEEEEELCSRRNSTVFHAPRRGGGAE